MVKPMDKPTLSTLSLCQKAGKIVSGEAAAEKALQGQTAYLVIVAEDASDNTKTKFRNKTQFYKVPFIIQYEKEELGRAIGKISRATLAVTDSVFASKLINLLTPTEPTEVNICPK